LRGRWPENDDCAPVGSTDRSAVGCHGQCIESDVMALERCVFAGLMHEALVP
jgi:hypothetical protein